jgi:hypothetical protein
MNNDSHRPTILWAQEARTPGVDQYIRGHRGEFHTDGIESRYPYGGPASAFVRQEKKANLREGYNRFENRGVGCWTLKKDGILNDVTADLLAAGDFLRGSMRSDSTSASPGGIGVESSEIWVAFLDGGVGVDVVLYEHERTNRVTGTQRTTILGPKAYRALLELLGFDWINRKLEGESEKPVHDEIAVL